MKAWDRNRYVSRDLAEDEGDLLKPLPYKGKWKDNPSGSKRYQRLLNLSPVLANEVIDRIKKKSRQKPEAERKSQLNNNSGIASLEAVETVIAQLVSVLDELCTLNQEKPPIKIIRDSCFTNYTVEQSLMDMLGPEKYGKYVQSIDIDYNDPQSVIGINDKIQDNSIIMLLGSLSDTYSIDEKFYESELAEILKACLSSMPNKRNIRVYGECFGSQLLANLLWRIKRHSPNILATVKLFAEFMPKSCYIENLELVPEVYKLALNGLYCDWKNMEFTSIFTRTGHMEFDLLGSGRRPDVIPLVRDKDGNIVVWGVRGGGAMGRQDHPGPRLPRQQRFRWKSDRQEYNGKSDKDEQIFLDNIREVSQALVKDYGTEALNIVENYDVWENSIAPIDKQAYSFTLLSFAMDILRQQKEGIREKEDRASAALITFDGGTKEVREVVCRRVSEELERKMGETFSPENREKLLKIIDRIRLLKHNEELDRAVWRGKEQYDQMTGLDLENLTKGCILSMQEKGIKGPYFFRDFGAGNGRFMEEMYMAFHPAPNSPHWHIVFYGVADELNVDLYQWLLEIVKRLGLEIPNDILILFTQEVIRQCGKVRSERKKLGKLKSDDPTRGPLESVICEAIGRAQIHLVDEIALSTMFSKDTYMFAGENRKKMSEEAKKFLWEWNRSLEQVKSYIQENFYDFCELCAGFFERIYLSDFLNFKIPKSGIERAHFQVAVRSTSLVDGEEYMRIMMDYVEHYSREGSIYIDNGVHRSYSSIPRLKELVEVKKKFADKISIQLVFDRKKNYFRSAIVQTAPFYDQKIIEDNLGEGLQLVSLEEAERTTFFRLERFFRSMIMASFRDYKVFERFNGDIVATLASFVDMLENGNFNGIKNKTVLLINKIVRTLNTNEKSDGDLVTVNGKNQTKKWNRYNSISRKDIEEYVSSSKETIDDILGGEVVRFPWFNLKAKRTN